MRVRTLFGLWLPLAVSFELMMLEGPAVQGAIGRLAQPALNLAAFGLTMSLSLLIESPVIMLLATAIALVRDGDSYRALRRFTVTIAAACTAVVGIVAFTPAFDLVAARVMHQPTEIVAGARPAMRIMLFWIAAIAWRRFYQGVLVRHGQTRMVSFGTAIRLVATVGTAVLLVHRGGVPGAQVGACALMAAVFTEALAITVFALPVVRRDVLTQTTDAGPIPSERLSQRDILRFHAPLAATTLLTLLAQPLTSAALALLPARDSTLAAWPVTFMVLVVLRGWGLALQEISIAQARRPGAEPALRRFTWMVGGVTSAATALVAFTPLLGIYLGAVIRLPVDLRPYVQQGVAVGVALPLLTALGAGARGSLVAAGATSTVYRGMGVSLATHACLLAAGVALRLPGMWVATAAFTLAAVAEFVYLSRRAAALPAPAPPCVEAVVEPVKTCRSTRAQSDSDLWGDPANTSP